MHERQREGGLLSISRIPISDFSREWDQQPLSTNIIDGQHLLDAPVSSSPLNVNTFPKLPVELLQLIFTFYAESLHPKLVSFRTFPHWLAITYVCRHWRSIVLNHHILWTSITPGLTLRWVKVLMERSGTAPVDVDILVGQSDKRTPIVRLCPDDVISLLANRTHLGSLRLTGSREDVSSILETLRATTSIHTLSLCLQECGRPFTLNEDLFGGRAAIRHLQFTADTYIIAPQWLLSGVTHFTCNETVPPLDLLNALRQMPALTYLLIRGRHIHWGDVQVSNEPIQMPHLVDFVVDADSPEVFVLLNRRITLPEGARRRLKLAMWFFCSWPTWTHWFAALVPLFKAANGLRHIYLSGWPEGGKLRMWAGDSMTAFEDAKFSFQADWHGIPTAKGGVPRSRYLTSPIFHLVSLCDVLGAGEARRLVLDVSSGGLLNSYWWDLLKNLPGIEELELYPGAVDALSSAWEGDSAPAVLPELQKVRIVQTKITGGLGVYKPKPWDVRTPLAVRTCLLSSVVYPDGSMSDPTSRKIVWLPNSLEVGEVEHAMKDPPTLPKGLIKLLRGGAGQTG